MARKFSLAYLTVAGTDPVNQIRIAAETGYDSVSLRTIPMHLPGEPEFLMHEDAALFRATKQALKEYGMPLMDIELARIRPDLNLAEYAPAFEKAAELGATDVLGSIWTRDRAYYTDKAGEIVRRLKSFGITRFLLLFRGARSRSEIVATFMAVLELCRASVIRLAGGETDCTVDCEQDAPETFTL